MQTKSQSPPTGPREFVSDIILDLGQSLDKLQAIKHHTAKANQVLVRLFDDLAIVKSALEQISSLVKVDSLIQNQEFQLYLNLDTTFKSCRILVSDIDEQIELLGLPNRPLYELGNRVKVALNSKRRRKDIDDLSHLVAALKGLVGTLTSQASNDHLPTKDCSNRTIFDQVNSDTLSRITRRRNASVKFRNPLQRIAKRVSGSFPTESRVSATIDKQIEQDRKRQRQECKVVLCGKRYDCDALWNQMYVKYNETSLDATTCLQDLLCDVVLTNVRTSLERSLYLDAGQPSFPTKSETEAAIESVNRVKSMRPMRHLPEDLASSIKDIWTRMRLDDEGFESMLIVYLGSPLPIRHGFDLVDRISSPDWQFDPSETRMLSALPRLGQSVSYTVDHGNLAFEFIHLCHPRGERRKWIYHYENVHMFMYVVNACDYHEEYEAGVEGDLPLRANITTFNSVVESKAFLKISPVLVLSNTNALAQELHNFPLNWYCVDYDGGANVTKAIEYLLGRFKAANTSQRRVYYLACQNYDDDEFENAMYNAARETAIRKGLEAWGF